MAIAQISSIIFEHDELSGGLTWSGDNTTMTTSEQLGLRCRVVPDVGGSDIGTGTLVLEQSFDGTTWSTLETKQWSFGFASSIPLDDYQPDTYGVRTLRATLDWYGDSYSDQFNVRVGERHIGEIDVESREATAGVADTTASAAAPDLEATGGVPQRDPDATLNETTATAGATARTVAAEVPERTATSGAEE